MFRSIAWVLILFIIVACKSGDDKQATASTVKPENYPPSSGLTATAVQLHGVPVGDFIEPPVSFAGKTFSHTIESGSGVFASTGLYTLSLLLHYKTYSIHGDDITVYDSAGRYGYTANSTYKYGELDMVDSIFSNELCLYYFLTTTSGIYSCFVESDFDSEQWGSFVEVVKGS